MFDEVGMLAPGFEVYYSNVHLYHSLLPFTAQRAVLTIFNIKWGVLGGRDF